MSKLLATMFLLAGISAGVSATPLVNNDSHDNNFKPVNTNIVAPTANATGGTAVAGATAAAKAVADSTSTAKVVGSGNSRNSNVLGQTATGTGGAGGSSNGEFYNRTDASNSSTVSGNSTDIKVERNTPPAYAPKADIPVTSCRLTMGMGASAPGAAGSGGFPIGNDQTCLSLVALQVMRSVGGFTQADRMLVACKIEGMSDTEGCKNLKEGLRAEGILNGDFAADARVAAQQ